MALSAIMHGIRRLRSTPSHAALELSSQFAIVVKFCKVYATRCVLFVVALFSDFQTSSYILQEPSTPAPFKVDSI